MEGIAKAAEYLIYAIALMVASPIIIAAFMIGIGVISVVGLGIVEGIGALKRKRYANKKIKGIDIDVTTHATPGREVIEAVGRARDEAIGRGKRHNKDRLS